MTDAKESVNPVYIGAGIILWASGFVWSFLDDPASVKHATVEGISVFAMLYVIAQAAERITEWVIDLVSCYRTRPSGRRTLPCGRCEAQIRP